jgi:hypothetical protein
MSKKNPIDERIGNLFKDIHPEEHIARPAHISSQTRQSPRLAERAPAVAYPARAVSSSPARRLILIAICAVAVFLLGTVFMLARFLTDSPAALPELSARGLNESSLNAPVRPASVQDTQPPSAPSGLTATAISPTNVDLDWVAASDDTGVTGYTVYRNGVSLANIPGSTLTFSDTTAQPASAYNYAVDAYDQAGNHSAVSAQAQVTTPGLPGDNTATPVYTYLLPEADTFVNAASPGTNYGKVPALRLDASPDVHAYLRFNVSGLGNRKISRARLMLYTNTSAQHGILANAVADKTWDEATTDYNNAPALGDQLAFGMGDSGTWISLDVTQYVTGEGSYNFGISTDNSTAISFASREAGASAPQLILDLK